MNKQIENNFMYHAPKQGQAEKYTELREKAKELAYLIDMICSNSREKALATTQLEQSIMLNARKVIADAISAIQTPKDENSVLEKEFPHSIKLIDVAGVEHLARYKTPVSRKEFMGVYNGNSRRFMQDSNGGVFNLNNIVFIEF